MEKLQIVESYDSFLSTVWRVKSGICTLATCDSYEYAEVCKKALEAYIAEKEKDDSYSVW